MTTRTVPLWTVADEVRTVVDPSPLPGEVVHYSIPALEETGAPVVQLASEIKSGKLLLGGGEVLISRLNPRKSRVILVEESQRPILASTEFVPLKPRLIEPRYLAYCLLSETTRGRLDSEVRSVTRSHQRVDPLHITRLQVPLPHPPEQRRIADFLDDQVARMETALRLREKQVALIALRRATEIAVALNSSATSSIRLRRLLREPLTYGANESAGPYSSDLPRYIRITDIAADGSLRDESRASVPKEVAVTYPLDTDDFLLARSGATVGKTHRFEGKTGSATFAGYLIRARFDPAQVNPDVMQWFFETPDYWQQVHNVATQATIPNVNAERYADFSVPLVPLSQQPSVALQCSSIDAMAKTTANLYMRQAALLVERKQVLITAAVTGQFDVTTARPVGVA